LLVLHQFFQKDLIGLFARDDRADENRTLTMHQAASPITVFGHRMSKK